MMETQVLLIRTEESGWEEQLDAAAGIVRAGGLVAFPTETVYGLGANALDPEAAKKIYAAKGRPSDNPLIVHIADKEAVSGLAERVGEQAERLMNAFWPGPLTMILPKKEIVPKETTGGLATVAIRMPSHPVAAELIRRAGVPIAAPSANASGRPSPTRAEHVLTDLNGRIPLILDGGEVGIGVESTIVDLSGEVPVILRPGYITREQLSEVLGELATDPAVYRAMAAGEAPKAPGMKYRHYAPKAPLVLVEGDQEAVRGYICGKIAEAAEGEIGVLTCDDAADMYAGAKVRSLGSRNDPEALARGLYAALREFDRLNVTGIYAETFSREGLGEAVMNRLLKAAGHTIVRV